MSHHHTLDEELLTLEAQLMELTPASLSDKTFSRMEQAVSHTALDDGLQAFEAQLAELSPAPLNTTFLNRLEQAVSATAVPSTLDQPQLTTVKGTPTLDEELQRLEAQLAELSPAPLSNNILSRMEQAMASWEMNLPVEEKIVPFQSKQSSQKKSSFHVWGAAAAIALMGTVGAVFLSGNDDAATDVVAHTDTPNKDTTINTPVPDPISNFSNNITNASNEGITLAGENQTPYEVYRFDYTKDTIQLDQNGNPFTLREPMAERVLIPIPVY